MGCANAVRLFAERTAAMEPAFVLTDANAPRAAYDEKLIEATEVR